MEEELNLEQREDGSWAHAENSPFSPFYVPDRKEKKNNRLTIALVAVLLLLLITGLIIAVSKLVEAAMGEARAAWNANVGAFTEEWNDFTDELAQIFEKDFEEEVDEEAEAYEDIISEYELYEPSPDDEYYVELADSIRFDLDYEIDFEEYDVVDEENDVTIRIQYAQVTGDIPAVDEINYNLKEDAMYLAYYLNDMDMAGLWIAVSSYVTYMDEEKLSVVVDERYIYEDEQYYNLYCMNFDLTTGTLLDNTEIIEANEELAQAFRKQSEYQNGESSAVTQYTDKEIAEFMSNEETLILYYTPVGLEIGYNHPYGWISATLKEYDEYLKRV